MTIDSRSIRPPTAITVIAYSFVNFFETDFEGVFSSMSFSFSCIETAVPVDFPHNCQAERLTRSAGADGTSLFLIRSASAKFAKGWEMSLRNAQQRMTVCEAACEMVGEGAISAEMKGLSYR